MKVCVESKKYPISVLRAIPPTAAPIFVFVVLASTHSPRHVQLGFMDVLQEKIMAVLKKFRGSKKHK